MAVIGKMENYESTLIQSTKFDEELGSESFSLKQFLHMKNIFTTRNLLTSPSPSYVKEHIKTEAGETSCQLPWEMAELLGFSSKGLSGL